MKSKKVAIVLVLVTGTLGIHRFYLGQTGLGVLYFLTFGLIGILPIIDLVCLLLGSQESFDNKYNSQAIQREILEAIKNK